MDVDEVRPLDPGAPVESVLGTLGAADGRPNPSMRAIAEAYPAPADWAVLATAPFSSARKWSGAQLRSPAGVEASWLLGAPEVLLPTGHPALEQADAFGRRGLRVLVLVRFDGVLAGGAPAGGVLAGGILAGGVAATGAVPAALVVIRQRIRPEAADILRYFAEQGVATKIISGDNALSVAAVARGLGLPGADHPVDAHDLPADPDELAEVVEANQIFGRVGPQQKRDIVAALKRRGHVVAMTGDGVNDVLALKDADVGVAMGAGAPATRAVARIVLLDNNFAALPLVVAEGRRVIGNIERVANLFLMKTAYSVLLAVAVVVLRVPYPFLPRHLTLIGSLTIGIPAFFLALAPNAERARSHFVGRVLRFAVPSGVIAATATMVSYLLARSIYTDDLQAETSAATLTLFLVALWALAIVARPYTWWRVLLVLTMAAAFAVVLVVPFLQTFFQLELVGTAAPWTAVGAAAAGALLLEVSAAVLNHRRATP
jgi:cation-transporting ATPase E